MFSHSSGEFDTVTSSFVADLSTKSRTPSARFSVSKADMLKAFDEEAMNNISTSISSRNAVSDVTAEAISLSSLSPTTSSTKSKSVRLGAFDDVVAAITPSIVVNATSVELPSQTINQMDSSTDQKPSVANTTNSDDDNSNSTSGFTDKGGMRRMSTKNTTTDRDSAYGSRNLDGTGFSIRRVSLDTSAQVLEGMRNALGRLCFIV